MKLPAPATSRLSGAETLFVLADLCRLNLDEAIDSAMYTEHAVTGQRALHPLALSGMLVQYGIQLVAETGVACDQYGGGPVVYLQFGEDAGDVIAHGLLGEAEASGDLTVVHAVREQFQYFCLPAGQLG